MSAPASDRVRFNTTIAPATAALVEHYAGEWQVPKGEALDRLVTRAAGTEAAERHAEAGLGALEEMTRRVLGDYTATMTRQLKELLEGPHIEASTARLLLFALLCHLTDPAAAVRNEEEALRVARQARADGVMARLMRGRVEAPADEEATERRPQRWPARLSAVPDETPPAPAPRRGWLRLLAGKN